MTGYTNRGEEIGVAISDRVRASHIAGLEGYRGIAATLIIIFHAYQFARFGPNATYPYAGTLLDGIIRGFESAVAWFFVLSGFLIFLPFARAAMDQRGQQSIRGFVIRRAIRIVPLYYLAIIIVWAWRFRGSPSPWVDLFEHLTFTQVFDRVHIFWTIGPAWSLSVEMLFYVCIAVLGPIVYCLCTRISRRGARVALLYGIVLMLGAFSIAFKWWAVDVAHVPLTDWPVYFGLASQLDSFAYGMLLAIVVAALGPALTFNRRTSAALLLAGIVLLGMVFGFWAVVQEHGTGTFASLYFHAATGPIFLMILAATVLGTSGSIGQLAMSLPFMEFLGTISYSMYLWHEPIMIALGNRGVLVSRDPHLFPLSALALVAASILTATISYWAVERPIMNLSHLFTRSGHLANRYPAPNPRPLPPTA